MPEYVSKAVDAMHALLRDNLPARIDTLQGALSVDECEIPQPVDYVRHRAPFDNRSPLVQVFDTAGLEAIEQDDGIWTVPVEVRISYLGDANLDDGEVTMRRYVTAILQTVLDDESLGGEAAGATFVTGEPSQTIGDESATRYVWSTTWGVVICSPLA